jgi:hypothetical protein
MKIGVQNAVTESQADNETHAEIEQSPASGAFTTKGTLPPVAETAAWHQAGTSKTDGAYSEVTDELTDEQIAKLLEKVQTQGALEALLKKYPADQKRIADAARTMPILAYYVDMALTGVQSNPLQDRLTAKYGARPRKYANAVDGSTPAELIVREVIPQATAHLTQSAKQHGYDLTFTNAELLTNFYSEGGIMAVKEGRTENLDGYGDAGVDTFLDRYKELTPWLHPCIERDRLAAQTGMNEKGERIQSITDLTLQQAIFANAAMYASSKLRLARWLLRRGRSISSLSDTEQFYWTTYFFNAGEGKAIPELERVGVAGAHRKWAKADDYMLHSTNPRYNAAWRTATFEYTRDEVLDDDQFREREPAQ